MTDGLQLPAAKREVKHVRARNPQVPPRCAEGGSGHVNKGSLTNVRR